MLESLTAMLHMGFVRVQAMATVAITGSDRSVRGQTLTWPEWALDTDESTECIDQLTCAFATVMDMHGIDTHRRWHAVIGTADTNYHLTDKC